MTSRYQQSNTRVTKASEVMLGTVRPLLPWENDNIQNQEGVTSFSSAHDFMISVLFHELLSFNSILLKRVATDSVVSKNILTKINFKI